MKVTHQIISQLAIDCRWGNEVEEKLHQLLTLSQLQEKALTYFTSDTFVYLTLKSKFNPSAPHKFINKKRLDYGKKNKDLNLSKLQALLEF